LYSIEYLRDKAVKIFDLSLWSPLVTFHRRGPARVKLTQVYSRYACEEPLIKRVFVRTRAKDLFK